MTKRDKALVTINRDPLVPIKLSDISTDRDPCFGKGYDLSTKECKLCGDSEFCCLKMAQALKVTRRQLEKTEHYKDLEVLHDTRTIQKDMRKMKRQGLSRIEIVEKCNTKYEVPKKDLRNIYRHIKTLE